MTSVESTSISLTWSIPSSLVKVESYEVMWQDVTGHPKKSDSDIESSGSITETSYTIEGLLTTTVYSVTVAANTNITYQRSISEPIITYTGI